MMKGYHQFFSFFLCVFCFNLFSSQEIREKCNLKKTYFEDLYRVNAENLKCLAKNSTKRNTIFLTFARWCGPCLYHLPQFMKLQEEYEVDLYVLLVDKENSRYTYLAKEYVKEDFPNAKIAIISDIDGRGRNKKYNEFLKQITPNNFELTDDMSKFIMNIRKIAY